MNGNGTELEQVVHTLTSNIVEERLAERVWFSYSQSSLLNIYFRLREFQSSFLLIYFRYGPNTFTLHQKCGRQNLYDVWRTTFEIGAAHLQNSRQNHRSYVWTEALSVRYDFRYSMNFRCSMNIASVCLFVSRLCRTG